MIPRVITIDGPAGVGKTSLAERLAERLGYHVYDTGALYRAATLLAARAGMVDAGVADEARIVRLIQDATIHVGPPRDAASEPVVTINGEDVTGDLRSPAVNGLVSAVSQLPAVRDALLAVQRQAAAAGSVIMVGRDMGTVVVPDADLKIYLDADPRVRAERRARQLAARGRPRPIGEIVHEEAERDRLDSNRIVAPLRPAPDAIIILNDALTPEEVAERALHEVEKAAARVGAGGEAG
jgi:cytidylate kinase